MNVFGVLTVIAVLAAGVVLLFFREARMLGAVLALLAIAFVWAANDRYAGPSQAYESLPLGTSEGDLAKVAGFSPRITDGSEWVEAGVRRTPSELIPGCVREYWYNYFFLPDAVSFCFDRHGKLIHKGRYSSW
jgi:hypothetical protein